MVYYGGSTGTIPAMRVAAVIDAYYKRAPSVQSSALFADLWSSRAVHFLEVAYPYIIGGGEANNSSGWFAYVRRLNGSTRNTSSGGTYGVLGLPSTVWTQFEADVATLQGESSHNDGAGDATQGRRVYEFLVSTAINAEKYRTPGPYQELLVAWGGRGTSDTGTS